MDKKILIFLFSLLLGIDGISQEMGCGTDQKRKEYFESLTPEQQEKFTNQRKEYEKEIQSYIKEKANLNNGIYDKSSILYTIPVVVHIIHEGGDENITNEQVQDAIEQLNKYYQKRNSNWNQVVEDFLPIVADVQIEFKLAKLDPNGNCTNGITRTFSTETNNGEAGTENRVAIVRNAQGNWPGDKYMNVFVAKNVGENVGGYTYYPSNNARGRTMENGIHIIQDAMGTIGTGKPSNIHVLSHEVGHWLNLAHTWGDNNEPGDTLSCGSDDYVPDTPLTIGSPVCNLTLNSCNDTEYPSLSSWDYNVVDNVENVMDYSYCAKMFTEGQKQRMHAALNSSVGGRDNIHTATNLAATGVNNAETLCSADFQANITNVCVGQTVKFKNLTGVATANWEWEFPGGFPSTSTQKDPIITYNTPGTYKVELNANQLGDSVNETKLAYIKVLNNDAKLPFSEDFEGVNPLGEDAWSVANPNNNQEFKITPLTSYSGTKSLRLANNVAQKGSKDELISMPIDLSEAAENDNIVLSFKYSYRKRLSTDSDRLLIYTSIDCGKTWSARAYFSAKDMSDNEVVTGNWTPSTKSDWKSGETNNFSSDLRISNLRIKFSFESGGGNNFYLDDINLSINGTTNINTEANLVKSLNIYPNPAKDITNISFVVDENQETTINLVNMMGQTVKSISTVANRGINKVEINTHDVDSGVYLLKINVGNSQEVKRLIIQ